MVHQLKPAHINGHLQRALLSANRFAREEEAQIGRYERLQAHRRKYFDCLDKRFYLKLGLLLAPMLHLLAVLQEGLVIQPISLELVEGVVSQASEFWASLIMVALLFACSLLVGHLIHDAQLGKDDIVPGRYRTQKPFSLVAAAVLIVLYFWMLYKLTALARAWLGGEHAYTSFVFLFGFLELFLGYFAILGWEVIFVHLKAAWLSSHFQRGQKRMFRYAKQCSHAYRYYSQARTIVSTKTAESMRYAPSFKKVRVAVDYYEDKVTS